MSSPLSAWNDECRLNPARGATTSADPRIPAAFEAIFTNIGPALDNLAGMVGSS